MLIRWSMESTPGKPDYLRHLTVTWLDDEFDCERQSVVAPEDDYTGTAFRYVSGAALADDVESQLEWDRLLVLDDTGYADKPQFFVREAA